MKRLIRRRFVQIYLLPLLLFSQPVLAHKAFVFAWIEGKTVHTKSQYSGNKPVKNGQIIARDFQGKILKEGKTSTSGEFSFHLLTMRPMVIEVIAGTGHKAEWTITEEDLEVDKNMSHPDDKRENTKISRERQEVIKNGAVAQWNEKQLEEVVSKVLDKKLNPIKKTLVEMKTQKVSFNDIVGGIGYIIGLVGLAAYFRYRKN